MRNRASFGHSTKSRADVVKVRDDDVAACDVLTCNSTRLMALGSECLRCRRRWLVRDRPSAPGRAGPVARSRSKASSTPTPLCCATMPLACSITIRLLSAPWSCSVSVSAREIARSWMMAIVAMSARAWTTLMSSCAERHRVLVEDVQRTDHPVPQPHREGMHRADAGLVGARREGRPPRVPHPQVGDRDRLPRCGSSRSTALRSAALGRAPGAWRSRSRRPCNAAGRPRRRASDPPTPHCSRRRCGRPGCEGTRSGRSRRRVCLRPRRTLATAAALRSFRATPFIAESRLTSTHHSSPRRGSPAKIASASASSVRSSANACALIRASASAAVSPSATMTMPWAW